MPHINRIRVNNVRYNFGNQYYDDFIMRLSGKNTIYDLANGGGKSVLMMLLLQNMLPNSTLDDKQPVEKLFRVGNGNQTIHSLIEWKLNPCDVKNGFQFMTTGFCARKGRDNSEEEENRDTASIEYFNYCIFYREFNDNDLRNLPLNNGKERITYTGLRNYLKDLQKKDFNLEVKIFDRKGDYQRYISCYGIYESEWEIIRGINKTEGHVRTYFETTYKTTRKVVEDLLIEEIIQKSYQNKIHGTDEGSEMAKTLLDIKDKLVELSKKKSDLVNYEHQINVVQGFIQRLGVLKGTYQQKDGIKDQLGKAYYTCIDRMQVKKQRNLSTLQERETLLNQIQDLGRQIETACVQLEEYKLSEVEQLVNEIDAALKEYENKYREDQNQLLQRESANDYLDYLENQKQYESSKVAAEAVAQKHEDLLIELQGMAFQMKGRIDEKLASTQFQLTQLVAKTDKLLEESAKLRNLERNLDKTRAVNENELSKLLEANNQSQVRLEELRKHTNLLVLSSVYHELRRYKETFTRLTEQRKKKEQERLQLEEAQVDKKILLADKRTQERITHDQLDQVRVFLNDYRTKKERADKLKEIYNVKDYQYLTNAIAVIYKQNVENCALQNRLIADKKAYIARLHSNEPIEITPQMQELKEYILRHHKGKVQFGLEYLRDIETSQKELLLTEYPFLPYSLLLIECFDEVASDRKLREKEFGNTLIPMISMDSLEERKEFSDPNSIIFALKDKAIFLNEDIITNKITGLSKELEELELFLTRMVESSRIIEDDMTFIQLFLVQLHQFYEQKQEEYESCKRMSKSIKLEQDQILEELNQHKESIQILQEEENELERQENELEEEIKYLQEIQEVYETSEQGSKRVNSLKQQIIKIKAEYETVNEKLIYLESQLDKSREQISHLQELQVNLQSDWEENYSIYYQSNIVPPLWHDQESLETLFKGKKEAFENKNADVADKQKLAKSYKAAMEKSRQIIEYNGISFEKLADQYSQNLLKRTSREELIAKKQSLCSQQKLITISANRKEQQMEQKNQMLGGIAHARRSVEDKYGYLDSVDIPSDKLSMFIDENKQMLKRYNQLMKQGEKEGKELDQQIYELEAMKNEMERMMRQEEIVPSNSKTQLEPGVSLKESYNELRDKYERVKKEEAKRKESFERDKAKLIDTLIAVQAFDLSEEIKRSINSPGSSEKIDQQITDLTQTIRCIELEKDRISKGIEDMELIKDNFENQCLQSCMNIKSQLDRLSKLSKISMDNQVISIISLSIPYIKEELYKDGMANYINNIVEHADAFESANERLKYIRSQLAWKRLFGVIVTDMDHIKLNLYKRERIKEQSRYLKYEEAVGSTGQSQGIYIQFLVAIINYISSINSSNANPMELKKTVFIDNPFGAAKDIYIWEPIFKLLKSNNVQLIVPARGTTPAITGRFEVNYILGQKLIGGKQQTVVVDYRSQTEADEMEYVPFNYEQGMLEL